MDQYEKLEIVTKVREMLKNPDEYNHLLPSDLWEELFGKEENEDGYLYD